MSKFKPNQEMKELLRRSADVNMNVARAASYELAKALELPLRKGVMNGDIISDIFEEVIFEPGVSIEFPLDFLSPGTENDHIAYTIPNHGRIPENHIEGDYLMVPTYSVGNSIDWNLKYSRDARWDVLGRAIAVMEAGFTKKLNDDGWHVLLTAGVDRNILVFDGDAAAGLFTKRLITLIQLTMRRNGGGNSSSINRGKLTDLYVSPEGVEDIRNWGVDQIDEVTRREIHTAADGVMNRIYNVNIHDIDELGVSQEYQLYYTDELGASLQASDTELVVGLDLENNDSFMMPVKENIQVFKDDNLHRQARDGYYARGEFGFAALDNRRIVLGSF